MTDRSAYEVQAYNSAHVATNGIIDDEDRPFFLRKIWCHGQSVLPPIIAVCFSADAFLQPVLLEGEENSPQSHPARARARGVAVVVVSVLLCAWPFVSWAAIAEGSKTNSSSPSSSSSLMLPQQQGSRNQHYYYRRLRAGGVVVVVLYSYIVATTIARKRYTRGLGLLLTIFSSLAVIETLAFLAVLTCMRGSGVAPLSLARNNKFEPEPDPLSSPTSRRAGDDGKDSKARAYVYASGHQESSEREGRQKQW
eukprot:jgi/Psemu1/28291/gm1.28291_g